MASPSVVQRSADEPWHGDRLIPPPIAPASGGRKANAGCRALPERGISPGVKVSIRPLTLLSGLALAACAAPAARGPGAETARPVGAGGDAGPPAPEANDGAEPVAGAAPTNPGGPTPSTDAPSSPGAPPAPERHGRPLPELSVKSFGLHIGGRAQDAAAREQFLRPLEGASTRYLDCYRLVAEPGSVGTFGADLTVAAAGGKPRVGKPRTRLRGDEFAACMVRAFESVTFAPPPSGRAVVVSYSVKFNFSD
jgi:hypothetical protein